MSKTYEKPIGIPSGVTVTVEGSDVSAKGPQGELTLAVSNPIEVRMDDSRIFLTCLDKSKTSKSLHGLFRSLIANMLEGVSKRFSKTLEIQGVGFKASIQGQKLAISLGFSKPIEYLVPDGVNVTTEGGTVIVVNGSDKQKVGDVAARIRAFFPAEPFKGKGIRYKGENVRRKAGKTVA